METKEITKTFKEPGKRSRLIAGLIFGIIFGFLLQKGGVTKYDVIVGQLLLTDFTVVKIMLSAVVTGMIGIYIMKSAGWVQLYPKSGSLGQNIAGGLIFGAGFAILGYCPGTLAGAIGNGYLDALTGGVAGILIGAGLFAALYPKINSRTPKKGKYGNITIPGLLKINEWLIIVPLTALIILFLIWTENRGL